MTSLPDILEHYLKSKGEWIPKGELLMCEFYSDKGTRYMSDSISRKLRLLEESSRIAVKSDGRKSVLYKWLPHDKRARYIPTSRRTGTELFVMTT